MHEASSAGVARLEQQSGARALDQLGQTAGTGHDEGRPTRERLERHDAERLVQRRNGDTARPVHEVAKVVVAQEAGQVNEIADALDVDLGLELGEVAPAPADDALDARDARSQPRHCRRQQLEALLVLDAPPGDHQRLTLGRILAARPPRRVDAVRHAVGLLRGQLEADQHLIGHEAGAGNHGVGPVGQPGLHRVHGGGHARWHPAPVATTLGRVERGDQPDAVQRGERVGGPGNLPIVGVDDIGPPVGQLAGELHDVMVGRCRLGHEILVGQPRQIGAGATDGDATIDGDRRRLRVGQGEDHDLVARLGQGMAQPVDVSGDTADVSRRVLPGQHQDAHDPRR